MLLTGTIIIQGNVLVNQSLLSNVMAKDYRLESKYRIININKCNYITN